MLQCCVRLRITYLCKQHFLSISILFDMLHVCLSSSLMIFCFDFSFVYPSSVHLLYADVVVVAAFHAKRVWLLSLFECDLTKGRGTFWWNSISFGNLKNWFVKWSRAFNWIERVAGCTFFLFKYEHRDITNHFISFFQVGFVFEWTLA